MLLIATGGIASFAQSGLDRIQNIVVIFAENRSFDVLYGSFPGADGLAQAKAAGAAQIDRDGSVLRELPPIWGGLTAAGVTPPVTEAQTAHLPNKPFGMTTPADSIHH
jgi:phospholipase C